MCFFRIIAISICALGLCSCVSHQSQENFLGPSSKSAVEFQKIRSGGKEYDKCEAQAIFERSNSASPTEWQCISAAVDKRNQELLEICEELGAGEGIGGGCSHRVGSTHPFQIESAFEECGIDWEMSSACTQEATSPGGF